MVFELWTRPKLLISILNYINSLEAVVYTTNSAFFVVFTLNFICNAFCPRAVGSIGGNLKEMFRVRIRRDPLGCVCLVGMPKNKQQEAKSKLRLFSCFTSHTLARPGYELAQARQPHVPETNGRKSTSSRLAPTRYFSSSPLLTCFR